MNAQQLILSHLLPIAAAIAVLWLAYRLLFSNSNRLKFNRFYLLAAMLFSLALPLIGTLVGKSSPQMAVIKENLLGGTLLSEITVTPEGQPLLVPEVEIAVETASARPHYSLWQILGGIYLIGVGVMTLLFLFKLGKLVVLIVRSPKEKREGYTAVFTGREQGSFSFLRYAFFPDESVAPDIVRHERSHIAHHHSSDILFVELMMILQWFNPFIYLYKKELQSLHEYQADRDVVATGVDKKNYMMLILQQCTAADFSGMSNNFSLILTKKRLKMIAKNDKAKSLWWRLLATLPVLAVLMIANTKVAAQEQQPEKKQINVEIGQFEIYDDFGNPMNLTDTIIYNEDGSYVQFKTTEAPDPITGEMRNKITATSCNVDGTPNENIKFTISAIEKHGDTTLYSVEPFTISSDNFRLNIQTTEENPVRIVEKSNDSIYNIVEQMPEFPGGMDALMKYVVSNIKYPQDAIDEGKSGRVFVSFVVEKDGRVSNVKVMKGVCESIDKEAVRVVSSMPRWHAGMHKGEPVRVSFQMPIKFQARDLTGDGDTDAAMVRMEDEDGHSYHIDRSVETTEKQKNDMKPDKNGVYQIVEQMPEFPGGAEALIEHVGKNIVYPEEAKKKEIQGRVFIGFVVEKDGSINEVKVLRGIGGGCDEEAVRVIKGMPKWKPGMQEGKPVRVSYQMPIVFKLDDAAKNGLGNTTWKGEATGKKDGTTYTMKMDMEFESETAGYFIMTLTANKEGSKATVFEDVGLPFTYSFDGKKIGAIQPTNPDGSQLGEEPLLPYGFLVDKNGAITVSFYDLKEDVGIEEIVFKKVKK
jgi:TonB family protein